MKDDWKERGLKLEVKFHKEPPTEIEEAKPKAKDWSQT